MPKKKKAEERPQPRHPATELLDEVKQHGMSGALAADPHRKISDLADEDLNMRVTALERFAQHVTGKLKSHGIHIGAIPE